MTHQLSSGSAVLPVPRSPESIKNHIAEWLAGFPNLRFTVEQMMAEGDQVASRIVMQGTHEGTWLGIAPTGKEVSIRMIVIHRIVNGKIVEDRDPGSLLRCREFFLNLTSHRNLSPSHPTEQPKIQTRFRSNSDRHSLTCGLYCGLFENNNPAMGSKLLRWAC